MRCSTMMQYYYMKIFFYGKKVFTAGSCLQPAVLMSPSPTVPDTNRRCWCPHHQRFWNRRWWPRYHQRLKSNGTQNRWWWGLRTGGDRGGCSSGTLAANYSVFTYDSKNLIQPILPIHFNARLICWHHEILQACVKRLDLRCTHGSSSCV